MYLVSRVQKSRNHVKHENWLSLLTLANRCLLVKVWRDLYITPNSSKIYLNTQMK